MRLAVDHPAWDKWRLCNWCLLARTVPIAVDIAICTAFSYDVALCITRRNHSSTVDSALPSMQATAVHCSASNMCASVLQIACCRSVRHVDCTDTRLRSCLAVQGGRWQGIPQGHWYTPRSSDFSCNSLYLQQAGSAARTRIARYCSTADCQATCIPVASCSTAAC